MKGGRPLLLETDSDEVRTILRSAELDEPPNDAMRRVLTRAGVGMGIAAVVTTATSVGVASQGATAGVGAGSSALAGSGAVATSTAVLSAAKVAPLVVGKWLAVAAFVGAGAVAAVHVARPSTSKVANPPALFKAANESAAPQPPAAPNMEANDPTSNEPSNAAAPALPAARPFKASPSSSADITGEIAVIALARGALDKGNARAGLAALDRYQQDYPHGVLTPEATVLRIEALLLSGERSRAKLLGEAFLKNHPKSPHAQRVRSLINPASP